MPKGTLPVRDLERHRITYYSLGSRKEGHRGGDTPDSSSSDTNDSEDSRNRYKSHMPLESARHDSSAVVFEIAIVFVLGFCLAAGAYLWSQRDPATSSTAAGGPTTPAAASSRTVSPTTVPDNVTSRAALTTGPLELQSGSSASAHGAETSAPPSKTSAGISSNPSHSGSATASTAAATTATRAAAATAADFKGITLAGKFAPTDSYTIATGDLANVPGPSSTIALDGLTTAANPAKETQGVIYLGDSTWYAAGNGGYGSCGQKLYDGQSIYFAAMSLYHWMGSPGPSPHCWTCIALQSVAEPAKTITAIVADSCEACQFAHIDLEQRAYFALGGTVNSGVVTVAWEFVDCPDGYSKEAISQLDGGKEFKDVELS